MPRFKKINPRQLQEHTMRLVMSRLKFLKTIPVYDWTPKISEEVTNYLRVLRGATQEAEGEVIKRAREMQRKTPEELKRLVVEGGDETT